MYQPYPGGTRRPDTQRPSAPASVEKAVKVMYVGAASSLIGIVIDLTTLTATKNAIHKHIHHFMASQINMHQDFLVGPFVIAGLISAGLWIFVAQWCKRGSKWARITGTALFGIDTLDTLTRVALPGAAAMRIYAILVWLIGLIATVLLWQRTSSAFFSDAEARP